MVIPRRQRSPAPPSANSTSNSQNDSHWLNTSRASRPWDSHLSHLKPATPKVPFSISDRKAVFESDSQNHSISLSRDSNPLNSFLLPSQAPPLPHQHQPPSLLPSSTRLGNRVVDPVYFQSSVAPPLVGLPVPLPTPSPMHLSHDSQGSSEPSSLKVDHSSLQNPTPLASHSPAPPPPMPPLPRLPEFGPNTLPLQQLSTPSRRYSVRQSRHSIRVPASALNTTLVNEANAVREQVPGPGPTELDLLPDSSSFLDLNNDARLNPNPILDAEPQSSASAVAAAAVADPTSFDDADSFDTFASLAQHGHGHDHNHEHERKNGHGLHPLHESFNAPTPPSETTQDKSGFLSPSLAETPVKSAAGEGNDGIDDTNLHIHTFSFRPADNVELSTATTANNTNDDEDGGLDIPVRVSASPAANRAMRDLQRASITAANELAQSIRLMSSTKGDGQENTTTTEINTTNNNDNPRRQSMQQKLQGQLMLRSRIFRRWNMRYATVINQAYFGAVLLLFKPDTKPLFASSLSLKNSKMIALNHSTVAVVDEPKKHNNGLVHTFSLTTSQRTYTFACNDEKTRNMWVSTMSAPPA